MKAVKKIKGAFHTCQSFKKCGLKQVSTWVGIIIFVCVFDNDLLALVHNVLNNANLSEKLATGLSGLALVWFNKMENK